MHRETRTRESFRGRESTFAKRSGPVNKTSEMGTVKNFITTLSLGFCGHGCSLALQAASVDERGKDVEDAARPPYPKVAATTCSSQWRRDAWVLGSPPLRTLRSLGPLHLLCIDAVHAGLRVPLFLAVRARSLWVASPGVLSQHPLSHLVGSWVAALSFVPPLPSDRIPLIHSPRREVASSPATRGVPTPRLLGVSKRWRCFGSRTLPFTNGGVVYAVVPCGV